MSESTNKTDGTEASQSSDGTSGYASSSRYEEVTLLDILLTIVRNIGIVVACVAVLGGAGLMYAFWAPSEYTSTVRVVRETPSDAAPMSLGGGGLSALQGLGIGIGGGSGGLSPEAFPAVLESQEVRLSVSRDTFRIEARDTSMTIVEFASRPGFLDQFFAGGKIHQARKGKGLTDEERAAVEFVKKVTSSSINPENGIMSIDVTTHDPGLSFEVAESIVSHLRQRVLSIRTKKTRKNLDFIEGRFREAEKELRAAEERLAEFVERNKQINSAQLRTQRDRLERKVSFKSNLYRQLQSQVTQARIDLQKREPVVTEVEGPNYPSSSSGPRRLLLIILGVGFGGALGILLAFLRAYLKTVQQREGKKVDEVKRKLKEEMSNSIIMSLVRKVSK